MNKQNYAVCCYTCQHNGQGTCKGCNTILNCENEPYENWQLREDLCQKDKQITDLQHKLEVAEKALELACDCIPCKECPYSDGKSYCYLASEIEDEPNNWECNTTKYSHYLEQAEKEIKGDKE